MKSLRTITLETNFVNNKCKLENILRKVQSIELNSCKLNTTSHKLCNVARDTIFDSELKSNLVILQVPISFNEMIPKEVLERIDENKIADLGCGRFSVGKNGKYKYNYEYLSKNIEIAIESKKIIYIMFIFKEYCTYECLNKLQYSTHSTCMLLVPDKHQYNAYYINSHGRDMEDTNVYKRIVSRKRTVNKKFDKPVELMLIRSVIDYWSKHTNIYWDETEKYTYLDSDLQAGDGHGVCFIYPQIILHQLGEFYNKKQIFKTDWCEIHLNSIAELLKEGKLAVMVKGAFTTFSKKYKDTFIKTQLTGKVMNRNKEDILEKTMMKENTKFIKSILFNFIHYINQLNVKNK